MATDKEQLPANKYHVRVPDLAYYRDQILDIAAQCSFSV